ncbi:MAG TPA: HEAT repeat domain-containing protein [Clostridia bacterium]|nr:HEAT repeat domain-containing protein [Clostridia bacterium]
MFGPSVKKIERWAQKGKIAKLEKIIAGPNVEFREAAFKALGQSGDHEAVTHLTYYVRHPNAEFRRLAAQAMGESGAERTVEFLRKLYRDDEDENVREAANEAILKINEAQAAETE